MDVSRRGKIARLPRTIREELNRRLRDGESGTKLLAWLKALPEVQCMVAQEFGGRPVHAQNLTVWRRSGYQDWLQLQQLAELVRHPFTEADEFAVIIHNVGSENVFVRAKIEILVRRVWQSFNVIAQDSSRL